MAGGTILLGGLGNGSGRRDLPGGQIGRPVAVRVDADEAVKAVPRLDVDQALLDSADEPLCIEVGSSPAPKVTCAPASACLFGLTHSWASAEPAPSARTVVETPATIAVRRMSVCMWRPLRLRHALDWAAVWWQGVPGRAGRLARC